MFLHPKCIELPVRLSPCASSVHQAGSTISGEPWEHLETQTVPSCVDVDAQAWTFGGKSREFNEDRNAEICIWCSHQAAHGCSAFKRA